MFLPKKKKKEKFFFLNFAAAQLATILANRWTGNKLFLRVALG